MPSPVRTVSLGSAGNSRVLIVVRCVRLDGLVVFFSRNGSDFA